MAAKKKRGAGNYLTDQNWDEEGDEKEEAGQFKQASEEILAQRSFRKAKRKTATELSELKSQNPFSALAAFATPPNGEKSDITKSLKQEPSIKSDHNSLNFWKTSSSVEFFSNRDSTKIENKNKVEKKESKPPIAKEMFEPDKKEKCDDKKEIYFEQLISLNRSVLSWIEKHVNNNPCIDLTPVFKDYDSHLKDLASKYKTKSGDTSEANTDSNGNILTTAQPTSKLSSHSEISNSFERANPLFSVAPATSLKTSSMFGTSTPILQTKSIPITSTVSTTMSVFASSTPIQQPSTFSSVAPFKSELFGTSPFTLTKEIQKTDEEKSTESKNANLNVNSNPKPEEGDDAQPISERKTIVEKDAFYQIRCKLFFKKGSEWKELGVGMLYLKPAGEKTQLLIRMETVTGKVLMNIMLTNEMPISRSGKNNIMVVSLPNPPVYSKPADGDNNAPCTYLVRVKGTTEADELMGKMKSK